LTNEFDEDDRAYLAQLRGWLALKTGNAQSAVHAYQQAIDLFTGRCGDSFVLTGWGYILLGNAYDQQGVRDKAMDAMRRGTTIPSGGDGERTDRHPRFRDASTSGLWIHLVEPDPAAKTRKKKVPWPNAGQDVQLKLFG
jgi:hypothetical protein